MSRFAIWLLLAPVAFAVVQSHDQWATGDGPFWGILMVLFAGIMAQTPQEF